VGRREDYIASSLMISNPHQILFEERHVWGTWHVWKTEECLGWEI